MGGDNVVFRVSVIIINYGTAALAIAAVESVLAQDHGPYVVDLHIVDNASPSGDAATLAKAATQAHWQGCVTLYPETENHGFGRGSNLVFDRLATEPVPPDFVFLLNPDARLRNDAIVRLADFLIEHPNAAIAGAKINMPGVGARVAAFRFPSVLGEFGSAVAFGPISRFFQRWDMSMSRDLKTQQVDWVAGAAMMARFSVIRTLGGFDPVYFLYYEEVDLMRRAQTAGWQTWFVAEAEVDHEEGAATNVGGASPERRRKPGYWYNSWRNYFLRRHGRLIALLAASAWMSGAALNCVISWILGRKPAAPLKFFPDFWHHAVGPLLGFKGAPR